MSSYIQSFKDNQRFEKFGYFEDKHGIWDTTLSFSLKFFRQNSKSYTLTSFFFGKTLHFLNCFKKSSSFFLSFFLKPFFLKSLYLNEYSKLFLSSFLNRSFRKTMFSFFNFHWEVPKTISVVVKIYEYIKILTK